MGLIVVFVVNWLFDFEQLDVDGNVLMETGGESSHLIGQSPLEIFGVIGD